MKLLLDTHTLIWWLADDPALPHAARGAVADERDEVFVSAASAMEVATKHRLGKLPEAAILAQDFESIVASEGFRPMPISLRHAVLAGGLGIAHKDPFNRLLIAQAVAEAALLVSNERLFDALGIARIW